MCYEKEEGIGNRRYHSLMLWKLPNMMGSRSCRWWRRFRAGLSAVTAVSARTAGNVMCKVVLVPAFHER